MTATVFDPKQSETAPVSKGQLETIVNNACVKVLGQHTAYNHSESSAWNNQIIQTALNDLQLQTKSYKFIIYCSLIDKSTQGPNGVRTSCGALWNAEKDGVWNYKYDQSDHTDAMVSVAWIYSA